MLINVGTEERLERLDLARRSLSFEVSYLDDAMGAIRPTDMVVLGAATGTGKTHLASIIAAANARKARRVHFFALEAEKFEIERRLKFQYMAQEYFVNRNSYPWLWFTYRNWLLAKYDDWVGDLETNANARLASELSTLHTIYRGESYTADHFIKDFDAIKDKTDFVIVDHLHYFDSTDDNEQRHLRRAVRRIRDANLIYRKPVLLIAHLRKKDRGVKQLIPDLDDFHGSSDITKIATAVITVAPCENQEVKSDLKIPTYVRISKFRVDSSVCRYVGILGFNIETNSYEDNYYLGRVKNSGEKIDLIKSRNDFPRWAERAKELPF